MSLAFLVLVIVNLIVLGVICLIKGRPMKISRDVRRWGTGLQTDTRDSCWSWRRRPVEQSTNAELEVEMRSHAGEP